MSNNMQIRRYLLKIEMSTSSQCISGEQGLPLVQGCYCMLKDGEGVLISKNPDNHCQCQLWLQIFLSLMFQEYIKNTDEGRYVSLFKM